MTDKDKIKNEIQRRIDLFRKDGKLGSDTEIALYGLINFIDSIQEELKSKFKKGYTIYYDSFGDVESMTVANVIDNGDGIPMYEDAEGNVVFENELIDEPVSEDLEKEAWSEVDKLCKELQDCPLKVSPAATIRYYGVKLFKAGSNWQKQKDSSEMEHTASENLEAAAKECMCSIEDGDTTHKKCFMKGANWKEQQLMKNTILDTTVLVESRTPKGDYVTLSRMRLPYIPMAFGLHCGDKVKVVLIKED